MHIKLCLLAGLTSISLATFATAPQPGSTAAPSLNAPSGAELMAHFECARCHESPDFEPLPIMKACVSCHASIQAGTLDAPPDVLARWQHKIIDLNVAPRLEAIGTRFQQEWLKEFLLKPHDLRPNMRATMPRFAMTEEQANAIASHLVAESQSQPPESLWFAQPSRGQRLIEQHGCLTCHQTSGFEAVISVRKPSASLSDSELKRGIELAPDLRYTRERYQPQALVKWLQNPKAMLAQSDMPNFGLSHKDAGDIAAFLLETPLLELPKKPIPARLPLLEREVRYPEVEERIFHKVCWHCHAEAELARGDGGPGNTGGFGFPPRGVSLRDYGAVNSGYLDHEGNRRSLFRPLKDGPLAGTPKLVAHMLARQLEEAGQEVPGIRGMPLGLPAFGPEEIQLLESWIDQGRPE